MGRHRSWAEAETLCLTPTRRVRRPKRVIAAFARSMSSSGSSDLETGITQRIESKRPKKKTKHTAVAVTPTDDAKNEGDDPHWDYEPPEGAVLLDHTVDAGPFEWDALHGGGGDDTEIWFIRAPAEVRSHHAFSCAFTCETFSRAS